VILGAIERSINHPDWLENIETTKSRATGGITDCRGIEVELGGSGEVGRAVGKNLADARGRIGCTAGCIRQWSTLVVDPKYASGRFQATGTGEGCGDTVTKAIALVLSGAYSDETGGGMVATVIGNPDVVVEDGDAFRVVEESGLLLAAGGAVRDAVTGGGIDRCDARKDVARFIKFGFGEIEYDPALILTRNPKRTILTKGDTSGLIR
jgi:hypothetical protein